MATMTSKFFTSMAILTLYCVILVVNLGYFQFYRPHRALIRPLPQGDRPSGSGIGKCTMVYNRDSVSYDKALIKHAEHCKRNGHAFHVLDHTILDDVWTKPAYLLSL